MSKPAVDIKVLIVIDGVICESIDPVDFDEVKVDNVHDLIASMQATASDAIAFEVNRVAKAAPLQARLAALLGQPGASEDELLGYVRASQDALTHLATAVRDQHPDAVRAAQVILTGSTENNGG
jgi:hypothetical protein